MRLFVRHDSMACLAAPSRSLNWTMSPVRVRCRGVGQSSRSRLALVWQATSEADLYGTEEMTEMQVGRVGSTGGAQHHRTYKGEVCEERERGLPFFLGAGQREFLRMSSLVPVGTLGAGRWMSPVVIGAWLPPMNAHRIL